MAAADGDVVDDSVGVVDDDDGTDDVAGFEPPEQPATNTMRANIAATNLLCVMRSPLRVHRDPRRLADLDTGNFALNIP